MVGRATLRALRGILWPAFDAGDSVEQRITTHRGAPSPPVSVQAQAPERARAPEPLSSSGP
jgi:hypothetical protein